MLVKVNTSLAGANFDFRFGQEVDQEVFASLVGNGWEALCAPVADSLVPNDAAIEVAVEPPADEVAVVEPVAETAVKPPVAETTSRRGRRK